MKHISTPNALILNLYNESGPVQDVITNIELENSESLREQMTELALAKEELDKFSKSPSPTSIRIILSHSIKTGHLQEI